MESDRELTRVRQTHGRQARQPDVDQVGKQLGTFLCVTLPRLARRKKRLDAV